MTNDANSAAPKKAILVNGDPIDYSDLPEHMQDAMRRYMANGIQPGSFLTAVLANDFMGAVGRADAINSARLRDYAVWLYNHAPRGSFGSPEQVKQWMKEQSQ